MKYFSPFVNLCLAPTMTSSISPSSTMPHWEHSHGAQWGIVLEGEIELVIDGARHKFTKGEKYFIPACANHSAKIHAGYADITFFADRDRYKTKGRKT